MKYSFLNKPYPVITGIMAGQTPQELIAESRNSEFDGAQGIAIDLADLKPEYRNQESLKSIIVAEVFDSRGYKEKADEGYSPAKCKKVVGAAGLEPTTPTV